MKILFHSNHLGIRGSEVALFDYAHFNRTLLGNESVIAYDANAPENNAEVIAKFGDAFPLFGYSDFSELEPWAEKNGCERVYFIKWGKRDGKVTVRLPSLVHAVFPIAPEDVHGTIFAFISEWLSRAVSGGRVPFVPHMINLPQIDGDLRDELGISKNAFVVASYGGADSFDVPFARDCTRDALERRSDLVFLFMNYPPWMKHERAIFLPPHAGMDFKVRFINTADAMLHARAMGESFGIACGEFSSRNKPVMTFAGCMHRSHIEILGDRALIYADAAQLMEMLLTMDKRFVASRNWDCYTARYSPAPVMEQFRRVFLRPLAPRAPV